MHPQTHLVKMPDTIDLKVAPLAEPLAIALHGLHRAGIHEGCSGVNAVAIIGAGPIGILAALAAKHFGVEPILIDIIDDRLDYSRTLSVKYTVNSAKADAVKYISEVTNGEMANAVLEMSGANAGIRNALDYASYCAKIALTGWPTGETALPTSNVTLKEIQILGARTATTELEEAVKLIAGGHVRAEAVLSKTVPFDQLPEAIREQSEHPEKYLKISALND